jgi:hypothetical protein
MRRPSAQRPVTCRRRPHEEGRLGKLGPGCGGEAVRAVIAVKTIILNMKSPPAGPEEAESHARLLGRPPHLVVNLKRRARARANKRYYRNKHPAGEGAQAAKEPAKLPAKVKEALSKAFKQMKDKSPGRPLSTV